MNELNFLDWVIFIAYGVLIMSIGLWVSRDKQGHEKNSEDYFLAGKSLPWWAIGASLIAANISAEQFIGMSGSGFAIGLGDLAELEVHPRTLGARRNANRADFRAAAEKQTVALHCHRLTRSGRPA